MSKTNLRDVNVHIKMLTLLFLSIPAIYAAYTYPRQPYPSYKPPVLVTQAPTVCQTQSQCPYPTYPPTYQTGAPTVMPTTGLPTVIPTVDPTDAPTVLPTFAPTLAPTVMPTLAPTLAPTVLPTLAPTDAPTVLPTVMPSVLPTDAPTVIPTDPPLPPLQATPPPTEQVNLCICPSSPPPSNAPNIPVENVMLKMKPIPLNYTQSCLNKCRSECNNHFLEYNFTGANITIEVCRTRLVVDVRVEGKGRIFVGFSKNIVTYFPSRTPMMVCDPLYSINEYTVVDNMSLYPYNGVDSLQYGKGECVYNTTDYTTQFTFNVAVIAERMAQYGLPGYIAYTDYEQNQLVLKTFVVI
jgi:hypothetical protein